jgi:hypothetical protein
MAGRVATGGIDLPESGEKRRKMSGFWGKKRRLLECGWQGFYTSADSIQNK